MKIICIGGGPAGLYFAICMKLKNPICHISIVERNPPEHMSGWGIILPSKIVSRMMEYDSKSTEAIKKAFIYWEDIAVDFKNIHFRLKGHGFSAIARLQLLKILRERARELDINITFNQEILPKNLKLSDADLIVACDGAYSKIRDYFSGQFRVQVDYRPNKYKWLGTSRLFKDSLSFIFEKTSHGWIWAHCYQFSPTTSTFLIECTEKTWHQLGFGIMKEKQVLEACKDIFSEHLEGNILLGSAAAVSTETESSWVNFPLVKCKKWYYQNLVLMGDAAHTAHFSIGSGTRLALGDAIDLATILNDENSLQAALKKYQNIRETELNYFSQTAFNSMRWFENIDRYATLEPLEFIYALWSRAQGRFSKENLVDIKVYPKGKVYA